MSNAWQPPPPPTTPMDPQLKSILTSTLMLAAGSIATWAAGHGFIPATDQGNLTNEIVSAVFAAGALAVLWWKKRNQSPPALIASVKASPNGQTALIAAVNTSGNGLKVVNENVPAPTETEPLRGPK